MKNKIKTETEFTTQTQNLPKQYRFKKQILNFVAVIVGFVMICGVLGILDILAQRELRKTGDALPKLFLYRWEHNIKNKYPPVVIEFAKANQYLAHDPLIGPTRDLKKVFPNLVDDHLPYVFANYFKIFIRQSCISNFESHSKMQPSITTPELLSKLERPFIICLGGSTTEPFLKTIKEESEGKYLAVANGTWSEELTRMMENQKICGTVFCGGTGGYTTSSDLLKLLRDVLEIKPNIIISYGGYNDLIRHRDFQIYTKWIFDHYKSNNNYRKSPLPKYFVFPNLIRYLTSNRNQENMVDGEFTPLELYGGVKSELNEAEYMIRNWVIMNEICKLYDIKFYGVLQPCVGSTERTRNDKKLISDKWFENVLHNDELWRPCFDVLVKNYDLAISEISQYDFLYDFSDIFDGQDLSIIYPYVKDGCHVSQAGNCIVAENMFRILFDKSVPVADSDKGKTNCK
jgi:hypothetical protein